MRARSCVLWSSVVLLSLVPISCGGGEEEPLEAEVSGFLRPDEGVDTAGKAGSSASRPPAASAPVPVQGQPAGEVREPTRPPAKEALAAIDPPPVAQEARPIEAGADLPDPTPRVQPPSTAELEAFARLEEGRYDEAARAFSALLLEGVAGTGQGDRPGLTRWTEGLRKAQKNHRWSVRGDWPSIEVQVRSGDSLVAIRKRVLDEHPELLICTGLVERANQLRNERAIRPDDTLRIPTDRASVLVDLDSRWVLYRLADEVVAAWEVGIGKDQSETPLGRFEIGLKQKDPMWFRPGHEPVPFEDPENPLGTRWLAWYEGGKGTSIGFHGTNDPAGLGGRVSQGCIRMRNEDVEELFEILPLNATVVVQP